MWSPSNLRNTSLRILFVLLGTTSCAAFAAGIDGNVVDATGAPIANAVVYALPTSPKSLPVPSAAIMDQIDKEYVPFVVPVQAGAAVRFPNKDNIRHHVYSFSPAKPFELKLYSGTPAKPVVFDKPGPVALGCNIHDWMVGYIYVVDSPWFAKTDKSGVAKLAGLPAGEYQVHVWHPWMKAEPTPIALKIGENTESATFRMEIVIPPKVSRTEK